jgi:hypothetical protein
MACRLRLRLAAVCLQDHAKRQRHRLYIVLADINNLDVGVR